MIIRTESVGHQFTCTQRLFVCAASNATLSPLCRVYRRTDSYYQLLVHGGCMPSYLKPTTYPYVPEVPLLSVSINMGIVLGRAIGQQRSSREHPSTDVSPFRGPSSLQTPTLPIVAQFFSRKRLISRFHKPATQGVTDGTAEKTTTFLIKCARAYVNWQGAPSDNPWHRYARVVPIYCYIAFGVFPFLQSVIRYFV